MMQMNSLGTLVRNDRLVAYYVILKRQRLNEREFGADV